MRNNQHLQRLALLSNTLNALFRFCLLSSPFFLSSCTTKAEPSSQLAPQSKLIGEVATTNARSMQYLASPAILIFSETRDWRHEDGIAGANLAIIKAAKDMGLGYFSTEHSGVFNDKDLARFSTVVFNNMTGDALSEEQESAYLRWQAKGNGTLLIHGSGDGSQSRWSQYHERLVGAVFVSHPMAPQIQAASVKVLHATHPVMQGVPEEFTANDEWYTFEAPPGDEFTLLAGLDESTYSPRNTVYGDRSDLSMGPNPRDHPIIWARCYGNSQARSVFTAMGHQYQTYEAAEASLILENALNWVTRKSDTESVGCAK